MARIVTVYAMWYRRFTLEDMAHIRWFKISQELARLGHQVDMATNEPRWFLRRAPVVMASNLKRIPLTAVRWRDYDMVKTEVHRGFETLEHYGGCDHPFIVSKLGSVVGSKDMDGIYFYGTRRKQLYATQERVRRHSRFIVLLTEPAKRLWAECLGADDRVLLVPGAVDRDIAPRGRDPYPDRGKVRCVFAGNIYSQKRQSQPEANRTLVDKLNRLGKQLDARGVRLYLLGQGDVRRLDRGCVTYLGSVPYDRAWDYLYHADVGVVLSAGHFMHNNESTKIYHYLRAGLPVVSESGFPNDHVVRESRCGIVVESGNMDTLADAVAVAAQTPWDRDYAIRYVLQNHTWEHRAAIYDRLLSQHGHA